MIRQIVCREHAVSLHREDKAMGYRIRKVFISCQTPKGHGLTINGEFHPLSDIHCDLCNEVITGDIVQAVTTYNSDEEPREWEHEYGKVLTDDTVKAHDILSK